MHKVVDVVHRAGDANEHAAVGAVGGVVGARVVPGHVALGADAVELEDVVQGQVVARHDGKVHVATSPARHLACDGHQQGEALEVGRGEEYMPVAPAATAGLDQRLQRAGKFVKPDLAVKVVLRRLGRRDGHGRRGRGCARGLLWWRRLWLPWISPLRRGLVGLGVVFWRSAVGDVVLVDVGRNAAAGEVVDDGQAQHEQDGPLPA